MVQPPTNEHLQKLAERFGLRLDEDAATSFRGLVEGTLGSYRRLDQLIEP